MSRHFIDEEPDRDDPYDRHAGVQWLPRYGWQGTRSMADPQDAPDPETGVRGPDVPSPPSESDPFARVEAGAS